MTHNGNALHMRRYIAGKRRGNGGGYLSRRFGEHEAYGICAGIDGGSYSRFVRQTTNFDHRCHANRAALPARRISRINPAGSALRIKAVPTSAIR